MNLRFAVLVVLIGILFSFTILGQEESSSMFPLCRSMAGDRELPNPYGIGITYHYQKQDYSLSDIMVSLPGIDLAQASSAVEVENTTYDANLKLDLWLLPFLNVFGIIGRVDGETQVILPAPLGTLDVDYDGLVYGGGCTLAAGCKDFFGSLTMVFTETDLDVSTSSVKAFVLTPRIGYVAGFGQVWIGAMYQSTEEKHQGTVTVPQFGNVAYDVELEEEDPWNYLAGVKIDLSDNWDIEIEGGIGDRKHVTGSLTYRF